MNKLSVLTLVGKLKLSLTTSLFFMLLVAGLGTVCHAQSSDDDPDSVIDAPDSVDDQNCFTNTIETPSQEIISYDPFMAGVNSTQMKITLSNESSEDCLLRFSVREQDAEPIYEYQFEDTGVELELRFPENQSLLQETDIDGIFEANLPAESVTEFFINAVITKDAVAAAGDHVLNLIFSFINVADPSVLSTDWNTDLILRSVPRAQVNLSGTTGSFGESGTMSVVDFGIAKKDATRQIYVQLRSNTHSILKIDSLNKGFLIHKKEPKNATPIPYSAELENEEIDLSKQFSKEFDLPKTYAGQSSSLILTLGDPEGAMAGEYSDVLTFEFSPL